MNDAETRRWIRYAEEDLSTAESMVSREDSYPRHICWLAQQAAEKILKAGLINCGLEFPYTHDLDRLRDILPKDWQVRTECPDLADPR